MPYLNLNRYVLQNAEPGVSGGTTITAQQSEEAKTFSVEYVRELREENKGWRLKAGQAEKERDEHKTAAERATTEADAKVKDVNTASEQRVIRAELKAAALKAGMVDLDGLKLADLSKVKLSESGEVEGAAELMDEMKKSKSWLFTVVTHTSTPSEPPPAEPPVGKKATEMSAEEYAAAKSSMLAKS